jgi:hypothetical protein
MASKASRHIQVDSLDMMHDNRESIDVVFHDAKCQQLEDGKVVVTFNNVSIDRATQARLDRVLIEGGYPAKMRSDLCDAFYDLSITTLLRDRRGIE